MAAGTPDSATPGPSSPPPTPATEQPVEPGHLPGPTDTSPSAAGAAVAVLLLCAVVVLLVLMVTGINDQIPYLHPTGSGNQVTVYGDRITFDYEFVSNGTFQNVTTGYLCAQCPIGLTTSASFALGLNITNPQNASEDVGRLIVASPFTLESVFPGGPTVIAAGLTESFTLTLQAPSVPGTYVVSLAASINVS